MPCRIAREAIISTEMLRTASAPESGSESDELQRKTLFGGLKRLCRKAVIGCMPEVACIPGSNEVSADLYLHEGPNGTPLLWMYLLQFLLAQLLEWTGGQKESQVCVSRDESVFKVRMYKDAFERVQGLTPFCPFVMSTCASLGLRQGSFQCSSLQSWLPSGEFLSRRQRPMS